LLVFAAVLLSLFGRDRVEAQDRPGAAGRFRVVVQLKEGVPLDGYLQDFAADARTRAASYHRREVVGAAMSLERKYGFRATSFFSHALQGFATTVTLAQWRRLQADPLVAGIEPDVQIQLEPVNPALEQQVAWGITKIGGDINSTHAGDGTGTVNGVRIYVIDTGIDATHPDLNVVGHVSFTGSPNTDCHGHGTAVAGIAAARDNSSYFVGVAPGAAVFGVKVFTCAGLTFPSIIIQAIDWVTANAVKPAVVNMSLGSAIPITSMNTAIANSAASGLFYAVAAGNGNPFTGQAMNACLTSPASAGYSQNVPNGVVTAAATDINDQEAGFSNFGRCVDLWAPGVNLSSTWLLSQGGTITASGTSFSSPYVAGAAALLLSQYPTAAPWLIEYALLLTGELPGTLSKDGRPIRRLSVQFF
jgi:subtilisin family serine protease